MRQIITLLFGIQLCSLGPVSLAMGQHSDLRMDSLDRLPAGRSPAHAPVEAKLEVFSYSNHISVVIQVSDPFIKTVRDRRYSDQVHLWLALPPSAYPPDFEYSLHPNYLVEERDRRNLRRAAPQKRYFSSYAEEREAVDLKSFRELYQDSLVRATPPDSLYTPSYSKLRSQGIHFGLVQLALFPDNRPVEILNTDGLQAAEDACQLRLGDLRQGISYWADSLEGGGYQITAEIRPEALGFVQMPYQDRIRLLAEVWDARPGFGKAKPILSNSALGEPGLPATFPEIFLTQSLYTNITDIPDPLLEDADFFPIFVNEQTDWVPVQIDIDGLKIKSLHLSNSLTELRFARQALQYETQELPPYDIETLKIGQAYVNQVAQQRDIIRVNDQWLETSLLQADSLPLTRQHEWFLFPDGALGLIVKGESARQPYGWGDCATCAEELLNIYRVEHNRIDHLLRIRQSHGQETFLQVKDLLYEDYFVRQYDWVSSGNIFVLRLESLEGVQDKRIKVAWQADSRSFAVVEVP